MELPMETRTSRKKRCPRDRSFAWQSWVSMLSTATTFHEIERLGNQFVDIAPRLCLASSSLNENPGTCQRRATILITVNHEAWLPVALAELCAVNGIESEPGQSRPWAQIIIPQFRTLRVQKQPMPAVTRMALMTRLLWTILVHLSACTEMFITP